MPARSAQRRRRASRSSDRRTRRAPERSAAARHPPDAAAHDRRHASCSGCRCGCSRAGDRRRRVGGVAPVRRSSRRPTSSSIVFGVLLRRGIAPPARRAADAGAVDLVRDLAARPRHRRRRRARTRSSTRCRSSAPARCRTGAARSRSRSRRSARSLVVALLAWTARVACRCPARLPRRGSRPAIELVAHARPQPRGADRRRRAAFIFGDQLQQRRRDARDRRARPPPICSRCTRTSSARSTSGLITIDPDGTVLTVNQSAAEILGASPAPRWPATSIDRCMPGPAALLAERTASCAAPISRSTVDEPIWCSASRCRRCATSTTSVIGRVINFQDLTELRRLEQHMQRAERLATVGAARGRHRPRDPQPAGVDLGLDRAAARRRRRPPTTTAR